MVDQISTRKILYVAGYGRSGSTLLCAVLGGSKHTVPVGEFRTLFQYYGDTRMCSCGNSLSECDFWQGVVQDFQEALPDIALTEAARITTRMESYSNWLSLRYRNTALEHQYQLIWTTVIDSVCRRSGCDIIVDASKSSSIACNRVAVLSRVADVRHVHLVRDPRSVVASTLATQVRRFERHGIKPVRLRGVRTILSWTATNLYLHIMHFSGMQRIQARVSYEMLTNSPHECLGYLKSVLNIDVVTLKEQAESETAFAAGHIFSGDLQRMKGEYYIQSQPPKWPEKLTPLQKLLTFITYPLARCYGFFK